MECNSSTIWGCVGYASQDSECLGSWRGHGQSSCVAHMETGSIVRDVVYMERTEWSKL
jgi:hypothetical protein